MFAFFREYKKRKYTEEVITWLTPRVLYGIQKDRMKDSIILTLIEPFLYNTLTSRGSCWYLVDNSRGCGTCTIKSWLKGSDGTNYCHKEQFNKYNPKTCPHILNAKKL